MTTAWQNWSGSQQHQSLSLDYPATEQEVQALLLRAAENRRQVRAIGSAHSFVPFWTDDHLLSLDRLKGLVSHDVDARQVRVWAGTKLHELGEPLWDLGLAMPNMGDIDRQSIAGAVGTGTHGTGVGLQNLSTQVVGLRLACADGTLLDLDAANNSELLRAAQVSMGTLGVMTQLTLQLIPAYYLHERNWQASVAECAAARTSLMADNRHWEFFWDPQSYSCAMKTLNMTTEEDPAAAGKGETIGRSYQVLPSSRETRFNEIEFSVPAEAGWECFLAVRALLQSRYPEVRWPLEYRTLKADDLLLSSASGRDSVTISAHQGAKHPYRDFFAALEDVFCDFGGRPHWGKVHTRQAAGLAAVLPQFTRFQAIRQNLDPEGRFLNPFLRGVFGVA